MTRTKTRTRLVRYVSPFGSPASMEPEAAEVYLAEDKVVWEMLDESDLLTETQRRIGPPRIGDEDFHRSDLPEWEEPTGDRWETIRMLVQRVGSLARLNGGEWVVIERDGRMAVTRPRYVIDGDAVRWEAR